MAQSPEQSPAKEPVEVYQKTKKAIVITDEDAVTLKRKLRSGQIIAIGSYGALLLLFTLLNAIKETGSFKTWLVSVVPLLILAPGLFKQTHRTYSWMCFISLMYFVIVIPLLMSRWFWSDWLTTILIVVLFISSMMTSRWLQYWRYYLAKEIQTTQ